MSGSVKYQPWIHGNWSRFEQPPLFKLFDVICWNLLGTGSIFGICGRKHCIWPPRWICIQGWSNKGSKSCKCSWFHCFTPSGMSSLKCSSIIYIPLFLICSMFPNGKGYDTLVGERGGLLSGGQRQVNLALYSVCGWILLYFLLNLLPVDRELLLLGLC